LDHQVQEFVGAKDDLHHALAFDVSGYGGIGFGFGD
jgi:hypothetical protein